MSFHSRMLLNFNNMSSYFSPLAYWTIIQSILPLWFPLILILNEKDIKSCSSDLKMHLNRLARCGWWYGFQISWLVLVHNIVCSRLGTFLFWSFCSNLWFTSTCKLTCTETIYVSFSPFHHGHISFGMCVIVWRIQIKRYLLSIKKKIWNIEELFFLSGSNHEEVNSNSI